MTTLSVAAVQVPGASVVKVKVTVPAVLSAVLGLYTAVRLAALSKVPDPLVVQVELFAPPPIDPAKVTVPSAQIV